MLRLPSKSIIQTWIFNPVFWGGIIACLNLFFWYIIDGFRVIPIDMLDGRLILAKKKLPFSKFVT